MAVSPATSLDELSGILAGSSGALVTVSTNVVVLSQALSLILKLLRGTAATSDANSSAIAALQSALANIPSTAAATNAAEAAQAAVKAVRDEMAALAQELGNRIAAAERRAAAAENTAAAATAEASAAKKAVEALNTRVAAADAKATEASAVAAAAAPREWVEAQLKSLNDRVGRIDARLTRLAATPTTPSGGVVSGSVLADLEDVKKHIAALHEELTAGLADGRRERAEAAREAAAAARRAQAAIDARLAQCVDRAEFAALAEKVAQLARDLDAVRAAAAGARGDGGEAALQGVDELRAALGRVAVQKADADRVERLAAAVVRGDKALRDAFDALVARLSATESGEVTAGRFRCLSCNRGSGPLYAPYDTPITTSVLARAEFPPTVPFSSPTSPGPVPARITSAPSSASATPDRRARRVTPGVRPTSAPSHRLGASAPAGSGVVAASHSRERVADWRAAYEGGADGDADGIGGELIPLEGGPIDSATAVGAQSGRRASIQAAMAVTPEALAHHAKTAYHVGSDGRVYGGLQPTPRGGEAASEVRVNRALEDTGAHAATTTLRSV